MTDTVLQKSIYLKATPAQVWAYLTDPDKLAIWFHKPKTALVEGEYEMFGAESGDRFMWGKILVAKPFTQLEYTFVIAPMGDQPSTVRWLLTEVPGGTNLSLRHEGLPQGAEVFGLLLSLDKGWDEHLARMRASAHED
ncbi:SRPBCC family protein [Tritonibacter scottomollicae]|uniref:SRPBCC family protein n=1 Tax=Tritonibacter scottomollicae TaxID=483013 RepID=UPI003AA7D42E